MECPQHVNSVPVHIEFIPDQAMTRRLWVRMMIVVPAFSPAQHGDPEAISGSVVRAKAARSPHVCGGVDRPCGVKPNHGAEENGPHHALPAASNKNHQGQHAERHPMPFTDPEMEFVFAQVRYVRQKVCRLVVHGLTSNDPAHM